ncbi:MAG TPA: energy transducer TonB, partial [Longimicrobiales bacterium]
TVSPAASVESPRAPKAFTNNLVAPSGALDAAGKVWTPAIVASPVPQLAAEAVQQRAARPSDVSMKRADSAAAAQGASPAIAMNIEAAPTFTPYTVRPELLNREEVRLALVRFYPPLQRGAGVEGTTLLWALVDTAGMVKQTRVRTSSGVPSLDQAAQQVAAVMRFSPALNHDARVQVWIQLPVVFKATP